MDLLTATFAISTTPICVDAILAFLRIGCRTGLKGTCDLVIHRLFRHCQSDLRNVFRGYVFLAKQDQSVFRLYRNTS